MLYFGGELENVDGDWTDDGEEGEGCNDAGGEGESERHANASGDERPCSETHGFAGFGGNAVDEEVEDACGKAGGDGDGGVGGKGRCAYICA